MIKKILLIHGPNLNLLGLRNKKHYGNLSLNELVLKVKNWSKEMGLEIIDFQSNHEGELIDFIQDNSNDVSGIIINAGALTHYSYSLYDCLVDANLPTVEVHLSDIGVREEWRKISVIKPACLAQISGEKEQGYKKALEILSKEIYG